MNFIMVEQMTIVKTLKGYSERVELRYEDLGFEVVREVTECPADLSYGKVFRYEGYMFQVIGEYEGSAPGVDLEVQYVCERFYFDELDRLKVVED